MAVTAQVRAPQVDATIAVLDELVTGLGRCPEHIRMDNGPELVCQAVQRLSENKVR